MDKEILEFLYGFYKQGYYTAHKSLKDVFDKFKNKGTTKWNDKNSIKDVWNSINRLKERKLIELDHSDTDWNNWGQIKEGETFDYIKNQVMAVLTEEGAKRVRQERVDESVIKTNTATIINIFLTLIIAGIVTYIQVKTNQRETRKEVKELRQVSEDSIINLRQEERDILLRNSLDSIRQAILSDTSR